MGTSYLTSDSYVDEFTCKLICLRTNRHRLTNHILINIQCNSRNYWNYWNHNYILLVAIEDPVASDGNISTRGRAPADLHWGRGTRLTGLNIQWGRYN